MLIDILFTIMTGFGFYFGYVYGPIKIVIFVVSLATALSTSMYFTPYLADIIKDTFEVDSPFSPFLSFFLILILVLLIARLLFGLFKGAAENERFNLLSQFFGGILMMLTFTFLFGSLISFFSEAKMLEPEKMEKESVFYPYIERIPEYGQAVLSIGAPFIQQFIRYMNDAIQKLQDADSLISRTERKTARAGEDTTKNIDFDLSLDSLESEKPKPSADKEQAPFDSLGGFELDAPEIEVSADSL